MTDCCKAIYALQYLEDGVWHVCHIEVEGGVLLMASTNRKHMKRTLKQYKKHGGREDYRISTYAKQDLDLNLN